MARSLEWRNDGDGAWLAWTQRGRARYRIARRCMADGEVYDIHRSVLGGATYVGSALSLERAQSLAEQNYERLRTSDRIEPKAPRHVAP